MPQDGKAAPPEFKGVQLRVSIFPTVYGEKIVCRIFNPEAKIFDITKLGFDDETLVRFKEVVSKPTGLILLTGPTGSGKTTAIYAAIGFLLDKHGNAVAVSSVEDPVEQNLDWVNQSSLDPARGYTYPAALRSLMRQDPEIIMVGEIRDGETADIAIRAALTGHLVFSTLHTNDAPGAFTRLIDMGIEPFLVASSVEAVMAQRLVRTICKNCKEEQKMNRDYLRQINCPAHIIETGSFYHGVGCEDCRQQGYQGRLAIYEMLVMSEAIRPLILKREASSVIGQVAVNEGMRTLRDDGWQKVVDGKTTIEEILRVTMSDEHLKEE